MSAAALIHLAQSLSEVAGLESLQVSAVLREKPEATVFAATLEGCDVILKLFQGPKAAEHVVAQAAELARLAPLMAPPLHVMAMRRAIPQAGVSVLTRVPGDRMDRVLDDATAPGRVALMGLAGAWLMACGQGTVTQATFGPDHWIKQLQTAPTAGMTAPEAAVFIEVVSALKDLRGFVRGRPFLRAQVHGDWAPLNAHVHDGQLYAVDIQGPSVMPVAKDVARFLSASTVMGRQRDTALRWGVYADDLAAMLASGVITKGADDPVLVFLLGHQIARRHIANAGRAATTERTSQSLQSWLADVRQLRPSV